MRGRVKYLAGLIALGSTRPRKRLHNRLDPSRQQIALRRVAGERLMLAHHPVSPSRGTPAAQAAGCYGSLLPGFVLRLPPAAATPSVPPLVPAGRGRRFALPPASKSDPNQLIDVLAGFPMCRRGRPLGLPLTPLGKTVLTCWIAHLILL